MAAHQERDLHLQESLDLRAGHPDAHQTRRPATGFAAALLLASCVLAAPCNVASNPLLAIDTIPGQAPPLDPAAVAAARALGAAKAALDRKDLVTAQIEIEKARPATAIADYIELFEARLLLAGGDSLRAIEAARAGRDLYADQAVGGSFAELLGEALLTTGDEAGARTAWQHAIASTGTRGKKEELRVAILASHHRTGTLALAMREGQLGGETPVRGELILPPSLENALRSPEGNLRRADGLLKRGRTAEAIDAYDAALSGNLEPADAGHAKMQRAHAQFRIRRYEQATRGFAALLPATEARFWHARSLARSGATEEATRAFEALGADGDPKYASWALYLAGTLLEDSDAPERALGVYERVANAEPPSKYTPDALWRLGWARYRQGKFEQASGFLARLAAMSEGLDALRPRYWSARAAERSGDTDRAHSELLELASDYPLSYYGWRATERLRRADTESNSKSAVEPRTQRLKNGRSEINEAETQRIALLLEADLAEYAQGELSGIVKRARSLEDRTALGRLLVGAGDYHRAQRLVVDAYAEALAGGVQPGNEALWWLSWPPAYKEIVFDVFPKDAVIEPALVWAIMREESSYRPWITSSAGARGLLQIMPETGAHLAAKKGIDDFDPDDLYEPRTNIRLGSAYLDELGRRFPGRISAAIGSYNAGPRVVATWLSGDQANREDDAWVEDIPYKQTRSYVKRVLRSLPLYRTFDAPL